ncbi:MAG TPA: M1 family aminopeptidase, partial [Ktedonobacterales bacterium]|nr:M1 family aminopeptidase [Ktedonobacterales bacterium]
YHWQQDIAFPAYLITLVVGEFSELRATAKSGAREIPLTYYVRQGREEDGWAMMGKTPGMIAYYTEKFGVEYPYVKYAQTVAETFLGAMENVSATTHSYRLLADKRARLDWRAEPVVAHELVHQWFGDLLTVRDWSHTWLKESFATYFEADWMRHEYGEDDFREELRGNLEAYLDADKQGRRPIVYNVYRKNAEELFDCHNYQKGSLVLHMLRNILGEAAFWRGIQRYAQRNQGREVITADFERALEEATGRSLARFFEQWLYKAGHPEFKVSYAWDDERHMAKLTVRQTQQVTEQTPLFVTPVDIAFFVPNDEHASPDAPDAPMEPVVFRVTIDQEEQTYYFPLARRPLGVRFDYGGWLIKTLDFERSADLLRYQLRRNPDVRGRIEAAEALGKLADGQSVAALEKALLAENHWAVRAAIARALGEQRTDRALTALITALERLDPQAEPKARLAIVEALGEFQAQASATQTELAERAAVALGALLENGDPSYRVYGAAAQSLGKTRTSGAFGRLSALTKTPSWNEIIRNGVFAGLGALGDSRVVPILTEWATNAEQPMDARAAAVRGLTALANSKRIDSPAEKTRIVEALIAALDDPWIWTVGGAISAVAAWGDARAIPALERLVASNPDERVTRAARQAIRRLQRGDSASVETRRLRDDLDSLRD